MVARTSKLASFPVSLPKQPLPQDVDPQSVASQFSDILSRITNPAVFVDNAAWRDVFALTGTLRTFYSAQGIIKAWQGATGTAAAPIPGSFQVLLNAAKIINLPIGSSWVEIVATFQIKTVEGLTGRCTAMLSVVPTVEGWKIWSMRTILEGIEDWPSVNQYSPPNINGNGVNGQSDRFASPEDTKVHFDAVVVGSGQAGLSVAGRLQALGVHYVVLEKNKEVGECWTSRYESARLHTIREYSHLPFERTYTMDKYPEFLTKDDVARGQRDWVKKFGVDQHIWLKSELKSGAWDTLKKRWTLEIVKEGQQQKVTCGMVVLAAGMGGQIPLMPDLPGRDSFQGLIMHSKDYKSAKEWEGKQGIVVGTANTGHDIADDMCEARLINTTMIQRSKTYVLPYEYRQKLSGQTFNEHVPTDLADKLEMSGPNAIGRLIVKGMLDFMASKEPERFDALSRVGFDAERYGDVMFQLLERAGGHYMDIGASKKIADGKIKVKSGVEPTHYTATGLGFSDGTELSADVVVWATGFELNARSDVRRIFGNEVADEIEDYWGIDEEGEVRGVWKLQHPGLILHGMFLAQARWFSKYIALQTKAVLSGKPFRQYKETPVPVNQKQKSSHYT